MQLCTNATFQAKLTSEHSDTATLLVRLCHTSAERTQLDLASAVRRLARANSQPPPASVFERFLIPAVKLLTAAAGTQVRERERERETESGAALRVLPSGAGLTPSWVPARRFRGCCHLGQHSTPPHVRRAGARWVSQQVLQRLTPVLLACPFHCAVEKQALIRAMADSEDDSRCTQADEHLMADLAKLIAHAVVDNPGTHLASHTQSQGQGWAQC
jgi:hypothetical protein